MHDAVELQNPKTNLILMHVSMTTPDENVGK